jgi:hypothetical protein
MARQARRVLVTAVLAVAVGSVLFTVSRSPSHPSVAPVPPAAGGFVVAPATAPVPAPAPIGPADQQVLSVMQAWRQAILVHDADTVLACDRSFLGDGPAFTPALVDSARADADERVRAFSTRVLGKLGDPKLAQVFRGLLEDPSAFVRENAAWALGELGRPGSVAGGDLQKVKKHDKAEAVRRAAGEALDRIRGGAPARRAG